MRDIPIPTLNPDAKILLLIGRDLAEAHHVKDQRFTQRLNLGWVVVGEVCLEKFHKPNITTFNSTIIAVIVKPYLNHVSMCVC